MCYLKKFNHLQDTNLYILNGSVLSYKGLVNLSIYFKIILMIIIFIFFRIFFFLHASTMDKARVIYVIRVIYVLWFF